VFDELRAFLTIREQLLKLADDVTKYGSDSEPGEIADELRAMDVKLVELFRRFEEWYR